MRRTSRLDLGIAAALLAVCAFACPAFAGKKDNSVRFAYEQTLDNIDPYFNTLAIGAIVAWQVWDTLVYYDTETGEYKGELATAWRWIDDKTLELDLRQGVRFHNGASFDADDVVYTLNFVSKPENKTVLGLIRWVDHAEKLGPYKVRIVGKQPFPAAIASLASPFVVIHPHDYYAKVGPKGMNEMPIGSGPFRVVEYSRGKYLRLERNSDYFRDSPKSQPKIDKLEIRFIPDAQTRVAEMVAGGLDLITYVDRDQAEQLRGVKNLQIVSGGTNRYAFLQLNSLPNTPAPQLRDIRVRQAIMYAIDRPTMVKYLVGNGSQVIHAECHPSQFGCIDEGVPHYDYDPKRARDLLVKAGYPNGFDIDFYAYRERTQSEAIIGYLAAVGIRARLRFMQAPAMNAAIRAGKAALVHMTWASVTYDLSSATSVFHEFSSFDVNHDAEIRDLLLRFDFSLDQTVRKVAAAKAFKLIADRAYVLPLYTMPAYSVSAKDLSFKPRADGLTRFNEMSWK